MANGNKKHPYDQNNHKGIIYFNFTSNKEIMSVKLKALLGMKEYEKILFMRKDNKRTVSRIKKKAADVAFTFLQGSKDWKGFRTR